MGLPTDLLSVGCAWKTSNGRCPGGILIRCPNLFNWLLSMCRRSSSTPSFLHMSELHTLAQLLHKGNLFQIYSQSHSLSHYPKLITIGEGCNVDQLVNGNLTSLFTTAGLLQCLHYCWRSTNLFVNVTLHFTLTHEQDSTHSTHSQLEGTSCQEYWHNSHSSYTRTRYIVSTVPHKISLRDMVLNLHVTKHTNQMGKFPWPL